MKQRIVFLLLLTALLVCPKHGYAETNYVAQLNQWLANYDSIYATIGKVRVLRVRRNEQTLECDVYLNAYFGSASFRNELIDKMEREVRHIVGTQYTVNFYTDNVNVRQLVPNFFQPKAQRDASRHSAAGTRPSVPLVSNKSKPYHIRYGLQGRHIALWNSHGYYYNQQTNQWTWQRPRLLLTVEDKLSTSYVLDYLLPMLEHAGANVLLPRERDTQTHEVIVDNDGSTKGSKYEEIIKVGRPIVDTAAFAIPDTVLTVGENPFRAGTSHTFPTAVDGRNKIIWQAEIPEDGDYAVYVSYHSYKNSGVAHYAVYHAGGVTHVDVNQRMGGGTWIYLGTYHFKQGGHDNSRVVLSNLGPDNKHVVSADAVRFGGGMGNVARKPAEAEVVAEQKKKNPKLKWTTNNANAPYITSCVPRYLEGARYWMQWAGIPQTVYEYSGGINDYKDDYASRGNWVNYLLGGSSYDPDSVGLNIPLDLSLALHTDAGNIPDTIVGTLAICTVEDNNLPRKTVNPNGQSRWASHDLADLVSTSVVDDIRRVYAPNWSSRGIRNGNYAESRMPHTPAMILELLSHQNFEDLQLGLDPRFQFLTARAIYKGVLRFVASQNNTDYVVQPLPVTGFAVTMKGDSVRLSWHPVLDSLEPSAKPTGYVVYTRMENGGFDNGILVRDTTKTLALPIGKIVSYKVTAVNDGGESFPSEVLCAYRAHRHDSPVLIVNGFTRICGPEGWKKDGNAGFYDYLDHGVPYGRNLAYVGRQHEFNRAKPWVTDDNPGFGHSMAEYETAIVKGNTFDFCYVHGKALKESDCSFVSSSVEAVEHGKVNLNDYKMVDLFLGEQRSTRFGYLDSTFNFVTFTPKMMALLTDYSKHHGALLVSGAHIGVDNYLVNPSEEKKQFLSDVLRIRYKKSNAASRGLLEGVVSKNVQVIGKFQFSTKPDGETYEVESADALSPAQSDACAVMRYVDTGLVAAVTGKSSGFTTFVCGFPFEAIENEEQRNGLMHQIVQILLKDKATTSISKK
ncbi:MAG: xanthan lyase [Bacteroidales bacterium]|nr:xanthan lyase [Bacteroidales bacterium]